MKTLSLQIDGRMVQARQGDTILQAAAGAGIRIPHMCYHEKLEPYGACRMCLVEIVNNGHKKLVASCVYKAEEGLVVETQSERVLKIRRLLN